MPRNKIAYTAFGGSGDYHKFIGGVGLLDRHADGTLPGLARWAIPILQEQGFDRFWCHNIGGLWPIYPWDLTKTTPENREIAMKNWGVPRLSVRVMHPNQWEIAQQLGASWATQEQLEEFHYLLRDAGMEEIVYYFGDPVITSTDEIRKAYLKPFVHLKGASFGFDNVHTVEDFAVCKKLFNWVRKHKARVYTEARPQLDVDRKKHRRNVSGTIATDERDAAKPEMLANAIENWGETLVLNFSHGPVPDTMTHLVHLWWQ